MTRSSFVRDVAARFPALEVVPDALFLKDGSYYTAAGVTSGIDLALALIEEDHGAEVALGVARELVVYLKRPGGQERFAGASAAPEAGGGFDELVTGPSPERPMGTLP